MNTDGRELEGLRILVTRPAHQADRFCAMVEAAGGTALRCPALAILPPHEPADAVLARMGRFDIVVFTSPNAVVGAGTGTITPGTVVAAVGRGTAEALARRGVAASISPDESQDSEGLLALPQMQDVAGRHVLLVRGEGGRGVIAGILEARGAEVDHAVVYRRGLPPGKSVLPGMVAAGIDLAAVTSSEALDNLATMAGREALPLLLMVPLVVGSERIAAAARRHGFVHRPVVASDPGDGAMLAALIEAAQNRCTGREERS